MRTTAEKVALFKRFFFGREDAYGTYDPETGGQWQEKKPVTDAVILSHLTGRRPYGFYLLKENRTRVAVVDFDVDDQALPKRFMNRAFMWGLPCYIERSKSKGYHVWFFFEREIPAWKPRRILHEILRRMDQASVEVFPKQDAVDAKTSYGNYINAPLFGPLVAKERTVFLDDHCEPRADQWAFLESIERISDELLDAVIELKIRQPQKREPENPRRTVRRGPDSRTFGLKPCAQKMLNEGVTENQRVACFRLAVQLRKAGLPFDCALSVLKKWARKNRPKGGKRIITEREITAQVRSAYLSRQYLGCGCHEEAIRPFCDTGCTLYKVSREEMGS